MISSERCGIFVVISSQFAERCIFNAVSSHREEQVPCGISLVTIALDTSRCELRRTGVRIKLRPKMFDILLYLITHRDCVISRQELLDHLWPDQFVSEATLSSCIMEARQAVGDTGQAQRLIQTWHGRGYRFVATVAEASESPPAGAMRALPLHAPLSAPFQK
jgi:DNA-binding winged helix-turn-helix (wHTH) protein